MPLTKEQVATDITQFLDQIEAAIVEEATSKALPLVGKASLLPGADQITASFKALETKLVETVLGPLPANVDEVQGIVNAIEALNLTGIKAVKTASGGIDLSLVEDASIDTGKAKVDTGDLGFLKLDASAGATIKAMLATTVSISSDGDISVKDQVAPDLTVDVTSDLSLKDFEADLGVVHVKLTDADTKAPELSAHFAIDLQNDDDGSIKVDPTLTADAKLDLNFASFKGDLLPIKLLPDVNGHLVIDFPVGGAPGDAPTISVDHVKVDLKSYLGIIGDTAKEVGELFNAGALGKIVDIATAPIPVLDGIAHLIPGLLHQFDQIGDIGGGHDGIVSLGDLVVGMQPDEKQLIGPFYQLLAIINVLRKIDAIGNVGEIDLGGGSRASDGSVTSTADPEVIAKSLEDALKGKVPPAVFDYLTDLLGNSPSDITTEDFSTFEVGPSKGFSFGLLDDPTNVLKLLFTPSEAVDLVKFDVPALSLGTEFSKFFPVLGPLGFELGGYVGAKIDIDVGYDSKGLATGDLKDGFYFSTFLDPDPKFGQPYAPAGSLATGLFGGAGLGFGFGEVTVRAGFDFGLYAYLGGADPGKFRPSIDPIGCIFSPISGTAGVSVKLHFKIGFGPFSVTKNVPLAEAKLADFTVFKCPPPTAEPTPQAPGLATLDGTNILLNVGDRADLRKVADRDDGTPHQLINTDNPDTPEHEQDFEGYIIGRARDTNDDKVTTVVDGQLDIFAFGVTQRITSNGVIRADFTNGDDSLVIQSDVLTPADVHGGGGGDLLIGGAGGDTLHGDGGEDVLEGHDGNDFLYGGDEADQLSGGKGADVLDGGDGIDTVDYSQANKGTGVGVTVYLDGAYHASGGEADGDVLVSIENVIGTDNNDIIEADGADFKTYLEGGLGNDFLGGGNNSDFLQGGAGGDLIIGRGGEDATTYVFSWAGVDVDLNRFHQVGGDAEGDVLIDVEDIQGTVFDDRLIGNALDNKFDAGAGNDRLDGGAGKDVLLAGDGDDFVYAHGDGDRIDGGGGHNTLSYENAGAGVTVDLGQTQNGGDFSNAADEIVMAVPATDASRGISTFSDLIGSQFDDSLTGDTTDNRITGGAGSDHIDGREGFDHLVGGAGADEIDGGAGIDWVEYDDSNEGVKVNLSGLSPNTGGTAEGDTFQFEFATFASTVENVLGSRYGDTLVGSNLDNVINPDIFGNAATETVDGGGGTDTLQLDYSSAAADVGHGVTGGFFGTTRSGNFIHTDASGAAALDTVNFSNIERLDVIGTRDADTIYGGANSDSIITGSGDDIIFAGQGADEVRAGRGNDGVLWGVTIGQAGPVIGIAAAAAVPNAAISIPTLAPTFSLNGGSGIDTLSISLANLKEDINIHGGPADGSTYYGTNVKLLGGAAAFNFEKLAGVATGSGNDTITQYGSVDNYFVSGDGHDTITPGLGRDYVDGGYNTDGLSPVTIDANNRPVAGFVDFAKVIGTPGDVLVLDYSSLDAGQRVVSADASVFSFTAQAVASTFFAQYEVDTNIGRYVTIDTATYGDTGFPARVPTDSPNDLGYSGIERLDVTGSNQNDFIVGTDRAMKPAGPGSEPQPASVTGGDVLDGLGGDDQIFGLSGNDVIYGGAGNDTLQGSQPTPDFSSDTSLSKNYYDAYEIDTLTGGAGADTFVAGTADGVLYEQNSRDYFYHDDPGRAIITDFNAGEGDVIQLHGSASQYLLEETATGTLIRYKGGVTDDRIVEVQGVTGLDLTSSAFRYVGSTSGLRTTASPTTPTSAADALLSNLPAHDDAFTAGSLTTTGTAASLAKANLIGDPFTVTQESDPAALKALVDASTGATATSLTLDGNAEAFGTFSGDPFGLGQGIILSTGVAEDLPGKNTVESGGSNLTSIPINFVKIGTADGNTVFRADLSGLNIDLRSIKITDSNSKSGGGGGEASGFDLAGVALSTKYIASATGLHLDNPGDLPRLDVFDFSAAGITFAPGIQRQPVEGPGQFGYKESLLGAVNKTLVDGSGVRLDSFADVPPASAAGGTLSLGDGGSIGFDLTQSVSTKGPLYLYIAEGGTAGETAVGSIDVSSDTIAPTGDLSTDLGAPGLGGDTTALTYHFTPKAGDNAFSMNVVLFTEELPEFDGTNLTDLFSIKLNGVEIGALNNGNGLSIEALALSPNTDVVFNDPGSGPLADKIKADAYTHTLKITGDLVQGADNVLTIEVRDGRDAYLDSGLLVQTDSLKTFVALPIIDVTPPPSFIDPFLLFTRLSGDVVHGLTSGNDTINLSALAGPTTVYEAGMISGQDKITGLGKTDILVVDQKIVDNNNDGIITFGKNGVLDFDGPDVGTDSVRFVGGPSSLRLIGADNEGRYVYADAAVRPRLAKEGTLADNILNGGAKDKSRDIFFVDTNLDVNWGHDRIKNFGAKDLFVTTSKLYDGNNNGKITLSAAGTVGLNGNSYFDPAHGGNVGPLDPYGEVTFTNTAGAALHELAFDGAVSRGGVLYYIYSQSYHAVSAADLA